MMKEGYLALDGGFERVGHTDVRHPAIFGGDVQRDTSLGYDWSSLRVVTHVTVVEDSTGEKALHRSGSLDKDAIRADFDFANQIYQQAAGGTSLSAAKGVSDAA